jgi:hypothetical protein
MDGPRKQPKSTYRAGQLAKEPTHFESFNIEQHFRRDLLITGNIR